MLYVMHEGRDMKGSNPSFCFREVGNTLHLGNNPEEFPPGGGKKGGKKGGKEEGDFCNTPMLNENYPQEKKPCPIIHILTYSPKLSARGKFLPMIYI